METQKVTSESPLFQKAQGDVESKRRRGFGHFDSCWLILTDLHSGTHAFHTSTFPLLP